MNQEELIYSIRDKIIGSCIEQKQMAYQQTMYDALMARQNQSVQGEERKRYDLTVAEMNRQGL